MSSIETITTKVRPIKKLFVIEPDDFDRLAHIIKQTSKEIWGLSNLILLHDAALFSENTLRFIDRHDPDVIVNYSSCSDDALKIQFRTCVYNGKTDDYAIKQFSTLLDIWDIVLRDGSTLSLRTAIAFRS